MVNFRSLASITMDTGIGAAAGAIALLPLEMIRDGGPKFPEKELIGYSMALHGSIALVSSIAHRLMAGSKIGGESNDPRAPKPTKSFFDHCRPVAFPFLATNMFFVTTRLIESFTKNFRDRLDNILIGGFTCIVAWPIIRTFTFYSHESPGLADLFFEKPKG